MSRLSGTERALLRADLYLLLAEALSKPTPDRLRAIHGTTVGLLYCVPSSMSELGESIFALRDTAQTSRVESLLAAHRAMFKTGMSLFADAFCSDGDGAEPARVAACYASFGYHVSDAEDSAITLPRALEFMACLATEESYVHEKGSFWRFPGTEDDAARILANHAERWMPYVMQKLLTSDEPFYHAVAGLLKYVSSEASTNHVPAVGTSAVRSAPVRRDRRQLVHISG